MLKQISNLLVYSQDLSSNKFLQTVKTVEEDVFPNSREFHLKVCKELKENQVYTASILYKQECLADISFGLKRLINLEFLMPKVEYVQGPPKVQKMSRVSQLDDVRRSQSLKKNNSAVLFSKPVDVRIPSRNISNMMPKHTTSIVLNANPLTNLQQFLANRS